MSAADIETISRAAALMRERAAAAQNWKRRYPEDSGGEYAYFTAVFLENAIANHAPGLSSDPHLRTGWQYDAEHLASWHPAVALAVADWLDALARAVERSGVAHHPEPASIHDAALVVARAYLGDES